ncbi:MAG: histidine kinase dimerization/phosphoacceptor domain -containing protein [Methanobacterium sp.]|nr:histidine kinase dimerization/phosphoacceptor domain -containing protein [Methanobacterium sp.]
MDGKIIKVLLIEDNLADIVLIKEMLKESLNTTFKLYDAHYLDEGLKYLEENEIDVLLLDLNLPDSQGLDTFQKANEKAPNVPIIILTAFDDEYTAVEAVKEDAQDYLTKGKVDSDLLTRSISYAIERKQIEIELKKYQEHLEELVKERTNELQKSNEKLKREIKARKKAEEEIRASLNEKKILLEEIHHRVENNLITVSNLIGMEYTLTDKEPIEIYQESQNRVKAIALIHETLSKSEDFAVIDFARYTDELVKYLFKSYAIDPDLIKVNIGINGILLDIDTAIPSGLILNELISNSLKHAFKNKVHGEINVTLSLNHDNFELTVSDDGIGLSEELNYIYAETPGLQLVNTLVRQLDGIIELEINNGTTFKITFRDFKP